MTRLEGLQRRALLQGCAAAIGTLAVGGGALSAAQAASPVPVASPLSGTLVAWVVLRDREVRVSLANFGLDGTLLGQAADVRVPMSVASFGGATSAAGGLAAKVARRAAARSWGVETSECDILHQRIVHRGTGRSVGYAVWVDVA